MNDHPDSASPARDDARDDDDASPNDAEALAKTGRLGVGQGLAAGLPAAGDRPSESNADEPDPPIVPGVPDLLRGG